MSGELRVTVMLSRAGSAVGMKPVSNRCGDLLNFMVSRYSPSILRRSFAFLASWNFSRKKWQLLLADPQQVLPFDETRPWSLGSVRRARFTSHGRRDPPARASEVDFAPLSRDYPILRRRR